MRLCGLWRVVLPPPPPPRLCCPQVSRFLDERHPGTYRLFNLSERKYDYARFHGRVVELGWPDHHAPPLGVLWQLLSIMHKWLAADPAHVAVVHCMAGKGRTGVLVAAYDIFSGRRLFHTAAGPIMRAAWLQAQVTDAEDGSSGEQAPAAAQSATLGSKSDDSVLFRPLDATTAALQHFKRTRGEGVSQPSQKRQVLYVACMVHDCVARYCHAAMHQATPGPVTPTQGPLAFTVSAAALHAGAKAASQCSKPHDEELARALGIPPATFALMQSAVWIHASPPMPQPGALVRPAGDTAASSAGEAAATTATPATSQRSAVAQPGAVSAWSSPFAVRATSLVMHGLPRVPGGEAFRPFLQILSVPSQAQQGAVRLYYNTAWDTPRLAEYTPSTGAQAFDQDPQGGHAVDPPCVVEMAPWEGVSAHYGASEAGQAGGGHSGAFPTPTASSDIVTLKFGTAVDMGGDILVRCLHMPGSVEIWRIAFHTAFLQFEPIPGVLRLTREQIDCSKRNKRIAKLLPPGFMIDLFYDSATVREAHGLPVLAAQEPASPTGTGDSLQRPRVASSMSEVEVGSHPHSGPTSSPIKSALRRPLTTQDEAVPVPPKRGAGKRLPRVGAGSGAFSDEEGDGSDAEATPGLASRLDRLAALPREAVASTGELLPDVEQLRAEQTQKAGPRPRQRTASTTSVATAASVQATPEERAEAAASVGRIASDTVRQGWLRKEGGWIKSWRDRYFVLRGGALSYYADEAAGVPKGSIHLGDCIAVRACQPDEVPGRLFCIKLLFPTRTYILQAPSQTAMEEWVLALATVHGSLMMCA